MSAPVLRVRALSVHAAYSCGNTGACCSSGWQIPIEPAQENGLRRSLAEGRLLPPGRNPLTADAGALLRRVPGLPHGARVVLACDAAGRCVFFERDVPDEPGSRATRCAVHHQLGEEALPSSCRQFPRVTTLTPLGASVTLSHFCPTAAGLLFAHGGPLRVVENPPAFPRERHYEGLDAREAWPPLLRPGVLMSWPALERWEEHCVAALADESLTPEAVLRRLASDAERVRAWTPGDGEFDAYLESCLGAVRSNEENEEEARAAAPGTALPSATPGPRPSGRPWSLETLAPEAARRLVVSTIPRPHLPAADESRETGDGDGRLVPASLDIEPAGQAQARLIPSPVGEDWHGLHGPVRRWLASKAFASWLSLQGEGLRTSVAGLHAAFGVLRAEAARGCDESRRPLDAGLLLEAMRRADLLLLHLADPQALARILSRCETR